jgi:hypothetical protein
MSYIFKNLAETAKRINSYLNNRNVNSKIKVARSFSEIKALEVFTSDNLATFFGENLIRCTIEDLTPTEERKISGTYKAKLCTLTSNVAGCKVGEKFFVVNIFSDKGSVKTKDLTPEKFNLVNRTFKTLEEIDNAVIVGVSNNTKIPANIKIFLTELYNSVANNKLKTEKIKLSQKTVKLLNEIKPADLQAIGKDFGEVLSLRWYISQPFAKGWTECYFSSISNEALVDYVVRIKKGTKIINKNISAKFEAGAAPSINAIINNISKAYKNPTVNEKKVIDVLLALSVKTSTTSVKILEVMKTLNNPGYVALKKIIGNQNFLIGDIQTYIEKLIKNVKNTQDRVNIFNQTFKPVFTALNKAPDDKSLQSVFDEPSYKKYYSLILSPMGYALVDYMNSQEIFQTVLNSISRTLDTEQVYLRFSNGTLEFKVKLFQDSNFKFAYGANAKDSNNTGIKFSMEKK